MSSNKSIAQIASETAGLNVDIMAYLRKVIVLKYGTNEAFASAFPGLMSAAQLSQILSCKSTPKFSNLLSILCALGVTINFDINEDGLHYHFGGGAGVSPGRSIDLSRNLVVDEKQLSKQQSNEQKAQEKAEKDAQKLWHKNIRLFRSEPNPEDYPHNYIPTEVLHETMMLNAEALGRCTTVRGLFHYHLQKVAGSTTDYHYICYNVGFPWLFMPRQYSERLFGAPVPRDEYTLHFVNNLRPEVDGTTEGGRYMNEGEIRWFYRYRYLPVKESVLDGLKKGMEYPNQTWDPAWPTSEWIAANRTPNFKTPDGLDWDCPGGVYEGHDFEICVYPLDRPIFFKDYLAEVNSQQAEEELRRGPLWNIGMPMHPELDQEADGVDEHDDDDFFS